VSRGVFIKAAPAQARDELGNDGANAAEPNWSLLNAVAVSRARVRLCSAIVTTVTRGATVSPWA